jgi:hypothetical protein
MGSPPASLLEKRFEKVELSTGFEGTAVFNIYIFNIFRHSARLLECGFQCS